MTYAGMVKRSKSHFENCNNGPEETAVQGDCSYILTRGRRALRARRPRGPNVKKKSSFTEVCPQGSSYQCVSIGFGNSLAPTGR